MHGTVNLDAADGNVAKPIAKGGFEAGGDRSFAFALVLLIGSSLITMGNGFFKANISVIVGQLYQTDR